MQVQKDSRHAKVKPALNKGACVLGTAEDLLEMTDLGTALTAAPGTAGSEMFPVRPSLWEQYMH